MRYLLLAVLALALAAPVTSECYQAQPVWERPYQQWSKAEAQMVLRESPWAINQKVLIKYGEMGRRVAGGTVPDTAQGALTNTPANVADMAGAEAPVDFEFTLRLRSALLVRQALARLKQLEASYDKLSDKERSAFDLKVNGLLECPACKLNYVVSLSSTSKQKPGADAVFTTLKGGRLADLQRYVYIANDIGERRQLIHFVPPKAPGDEAIFFFPRFDNEGLPLLKPDSKELLVNLNDNEVNSVTNFRVALAKLISNGQVDF